MNLVYSCGTEMYDDSAAGAARMCCLSGCSLVSVVVGLEGSRLGESHVLGLLVSQLCQVRIECSQVEAGDELVHQLGHQVNVRLVTAGRGVEQL